MQTVYPLLLGFVSTNYRRQIDLRYLLGGGITYQVLNKDKNWLKCSISSEYEKTAYKKVKYNISEYNEESTINTFRITLWLNGQYHLVITTVEVV